MDSKRGKRETENAGFVGGRYRDAGIEGIVGIFGMPRTGKSYLMGQQNFYGTVLVDLAGIGLASADLISPLLAALVPVTSELTFILNSTRLLAAGGFKRR